MRNRYLLVADIVLIAMAAYVGFALRFDWFVRGSRPEFLPFLNAAILIKPVVFLLLGMYSTVWRYASVRDLVAVLLATSAASAAMVVFVAVTMVSGGFAEFSRSVLILDWLLTLCATGGIRMAIRIVAETKHQLDSPRGSARSRRVLVVGAGEAGAMVVREMRRNPQLGMVPTAFLDDDRTKQGKRIGGVVVSGPTADLVKELERRPVDEVIIAMPTAPGAAVRQIAETCRENGITSRIVPGVFELLDGQLTVSRLRQVEISDLLRREQIATRPGTTLYLAQKRVLVTGAGGSIGSELCRQIAVASPAALMLLGHGENSIFDVQQQLREQYPAVPLSTSIADVRNRDRIFASFAAFRPDVVFHAAAHKHVPLMEEDPEEAITNNVTGTRNVVDAAIATGVQRLVMISTDKAVEPVSVMGASKRIAELVVRSAALRTGREFSVVRFGNVLGSRGSVVPFFKHQIERGGPITITHPEMRRFFMTIPEAVHLVLQAGGFAKVGELYVLNMGEPVAIVQLAQDLVRLSGLNPADIPMVFTGLRPGEKLEEALYDPGMSVATTPHPEVLQVVGRDPYGGRIGDETVRHLEDAASHGDRVGIAAMLNALFDAQGRGVQLGGRAMTDHRPPQQPQAPDDEPPSWPASKLH